MPTVMSRSSAPSSGCHVRSRCSSRSWGSRRLMARIIMSTYSAIGRLKTPRAFVMTRPRDRPAGVRTRSTPAEPNGPRQGSVPGEQSVERVRGEPTAEQDLDVVERPVGQALRRHVHDPGARGGGPDPIEVADTEAGGGDRGERDRRGCAARAVAGAATRRSSSVMLELGDGDGLWGRPHRRAHGRPSVRVPRSRPRGKGLGAVPQVGLAPRTRPGRRSPARTARPSCTGRA